MHKSETSHTDRQAAAYDAWFREQVQVSLDDPRPCIPSEVVESRFTAKRDALRNRLTQK